MLMISHYYHHHNNNNNNNKNHNANSPIVGEIDGLEGSEVSEQVVRIEAFEGNLVPMKIEMLQTLKTRESHRIDVDEPVGGQRQRRQLRQVHEEAVFDLEEKKRREGCGRGKKGIETSCCEVI